MSPRWSSSRIATIKLLIRQRSATPTLVLDTLLTPYVETPQHGPSFSEPPPEIVEGEEEYEIEAIIAHRNKGKRRQYLVKWLGYPSSENQWLPEKELLNAPDILQQYKNTNKL